MRISDHHLERIIAGCLAVFLAIPVAQAATTTPTPSLHSQQAAGTSPQQSQNPDHNTTPAATPQPETAPQNTEPQNTEPQAADTNPQSGTSQTTGQATVPGQAQTDTSKPVGTAAAPYEKTTGSAVSRPAGAVIAPAKQRRTRSFLIKIAVVIGAVVAVGIVVALTRSSPSHP